MSRIVRFALSAIFFAVASSGSVASAATFVVDTTSDTNDGFTGDGVCQDFGGFCSLRAAIQESNSLAGTDTVTLPAGTYLLTATLFVSSSMNIEGADPATTVIDGNSAVGNVFYVYNSGTVSSIENVTIQGGYFDSVNSSFYIGAGISVNSGASLSVTDAIVTDNVATSSGTGSTWGGGIANAGTLSLTRVVVSNNSAANAGGLYLLPSSSTTITDSDITGNSAVGSSSTTYPVCGGVWSGGTVSIVDSEISANTANRSNAGGGGGLCNFTSSTPLTITSSLIEGNGAGDSSAVLNEDPGQIVFTNTTISGNYKIGTTGFGGAIHNLVFGSSAAKLTFNNCTIANHATIGSRTIHNQGSGTLPATIEFKNTIIDNPGTQCTVSGTNRPITSFGNNQVRDSTCGLALGGDNVASANLLALADNGGPTRTHAIGNTSPALNAVPPAGCTTVAGAPVAVDQPTRCG